MEGNIKISLIPKRKIAPKGEEGLAPNPLLYYIDVIERKVANVTTDDATEELTNKTLNNAVGKGTWTASGTWTLPAMTFGGDIALPTTTGVKVGTATNQLLGFYNATPVDQPATVSDPSGGGTIDTEARTAIVALIDRLQELGLVA